MMTTPLTGLQDRDGGVAVIAVPSVNQFDSSGASDKHCVKNSTLKSPVRIFLFFHKAIRSELDGLHRAAMTFATNLHSEIRPLLQRYHFVRTIYKHHCNAEDEDLFTSVDLFPTDLEDEINKEALHVRLWEAYDAARLGLTGHVIK